MGLKKKWKSAATGLGVRAAVNMTPYGWAANGAGLAAGILHDRRGGDGGGDGSAPRAWTAQDEYNTLSQPERDWYTNREQGGMAAGGPAWTKDQYKLAQAQYKDELERSNRVNQINQWEESRNPYYASLYESKNQAAQAQNQQEYSDSMKRMQLQHAGRGTSGGSQAQYNQAELGAAKALRDSQAAQQNQNYVQDIRRNDKQQAHELRMGQNKNPYTDALASAMANSSNIQGGGYAGMADLERTRMQDQQAYKNNMSQLYGQAINNGASGAMNYFGGGV